MFHEIDDFTYEVAVKSAWRCIEGAFQWNQVEYLVDRIVRSNNSDVPAS